MNHAITAMRYAMNQDQMRMQSVMQNIANINTPAFKRQLYASSGFQQLLQPLMQDTPHHSTHLFTQGNLQATGNPAHLALSDNSFFSVHTPAGILYTRRGDFSVNGKGELTTTTGAALLGQNGIIHVDEKSFVINAKGDVFINNQKTDQIQRMQFLDSETLEYMGDGLFKSQENPVPAPAGNHVLQGYLETSNVKAIEEMADLTLTARHFETTQRILRMADSMTAAAINQLGENHV